MLLDALCCESLLDKTCEVRQCNMHVVVAHVHMVLGDILGCIHRAILRHDRDTSRDVLSADMDDAGS